MQRSPIDTLDFDYQTNRVCWKEHGPKNMQRSAEESVRKRNAIHCSTVNRDGTGFRNVKTFFPAINVKDAQMARDWIGKNWYFTDIPGSKIFVCNDAMTACTTVMHTASSIEHAVDLVLDPTVGLGFSHHIRNNSIIRWDLNGRNVRAISWDIFPHVHMCLAIDLPRRLVYWINDYLVESLVVTDYEGRKTTKLKIHSKLTDVYRLRIFEDTILVVKHDYLLRLHKRNYSSEVADWRIYSIFDVRVFSGQVQPSVPHPCSHNNGGCEHICLVLFRNSPTGRQGYAQCVCKDGFIVADYDATRCERYPSCNKADGKFLCKISDLCIDDWYRCNGEYDCQRDPEHFAFIEDKSDEENCEVKVCSQNEFMCGASDNCIEAEWVCDKSMDCLDNSDEQRCTNECSHDSFMCRNKQCIPSTFQCDGDKDCQDGSDEAPETCSSYTCPPHYYKCSDKRTCLHMLRWCDSVSGCPKLAAQGPTSATTTEPSAVVDGNGDHANDTTPETKQKGPAEPHCENPDEFVCDNGERVSRKLVCNRKPDCKDRSDESSCEHFSCRIYGNCVQRCSTKNWPVYHSRDWYLPSKPFATTIRRRARYSPTRELCHCAEGYTTRSCIAKGMRPIVLVAGSQALLEIVEYADINVRAIKMKHFRSKGMDISEYSGGLYLYWIDKAGTSIRRQQIWLKSDKELHHPSILVPRTPAEQQLINSTTLEDQAEEMLDIGYSMDLTIDWLHHTMYWTNQQHKKIEMATLDGQNQFDIVTDNVDKPYAVVVSPEHMFLYWSDVGAIPSIQRAYLNGTNRTTLVSRNLIYPTGLAIDHANERLYWADPKRRRIESVNLWGRNREIIREFESGTRPAMFLDVFENYIYYATYLSGEVYEMNKFHRLHDSLRPDESPHDPVKIRHVPQQQVLQGRIALAAALIVWHPSKHKVFAHVKQRPCLRVLTPQTPRPCPQEAVCLSSPNGNPTCVCPRNTELKGHLVAGVWQDACLKVSGIDLPNETSTDTQGSLDNATDVKSRNTTSHETSTKNILAITLGVLGCCLVLLLIGVGIYWWKQHTAHNQANPAYNAIEMVPMD
jgi:hypothetical protein